MAGTSGDGLRRPARHRGGSFGGQLAGLASQGAKSFGRGQGVEIGIEQRTPVGGTRVIAIGLEAKLRDLGEYEAALLMKAKNLLH